jgi:N-hydroxyarylamine O-acetyltransferase
MSSIDKLFRKRIGFPEDEIITFEKLDRILENTAKTIPFENLCIMKKQVKDITLDYLTKKILIKNGGGVCYEINPILCYFLIENGFNVHLFRGRSYNLGAQEWSKAGRTHILIMLTFNEDKYVVDTGYGINLPLMPVPITGEIVSSMNGSFRIRRVTSNDGDLLFEYMLKGRDKDWVNGYIFDSTQPIKDHSELNEVQQIIIESPLSPFNKNHLVTRLTEQGNIVLTETSLTERNNGKVQKQEIDSTNFTKLAKQHFGI